MTHLSGNLALWAKFEASCLCLHTHTFIHLYMCSSNPHKIKSRYYVFKVAACCFCFSFSPVPVGGPPILLFNEQRLSSHSLCVVCLCFCVSAALVLTIRDMLLWVPGLIAAAGLIVFQCYSLIDSLDSRGGSHQHPQTNKFGRTINNGSKTYRSAQLLIRIQWEFMWEWACVETWLSPLVAGCKWC